MPSLDKEEIVTVRVLAKKGQNHCEIAQTLGVTEGTVRYHLRRAAEGAADGRKSKTFKVEPLAEVIAAWHEDRAESSRPINVQDLHDHLAEEHRYAGSYRSVLRYVRKHYPRPKRRTYCGWRRRRERSRRPTGVSFHGSMWEPVRSRCTRS